MWSRQIQNCEKKFNTLENLIILTFVTLRGLYRICAPCRVFFVKQMFTKELSEKLDTWYIGNMFPMRLQIGIQRKSIGCKERFNSRVALLLTYQKDMRIINNKGYI